MKITKIIKETKDSPEIYTKKLLHTNIHKTSNKRNKNLIRNKITLQQGINIRKLARM